MLNGPLSFLVYTPTGGVPEYETVDINGRRYQFVGEGSEAPDPVPDVTVEWLGGLSASEYLTLLITAINEDADANAVAYGYGRASSPALLLVRKTCDTTPLQVANSTWLSAATGPLPTPRSTGFVAGTTTGLRRSLVDYDEVLGAVLSTSKPKIGSFQVFDGDGRLVVRDVAASWVEVATGVWAFIAQGGLKAFDPFDEAHWSAAVDGGLEVSESYAITGADVTTLDNGDPVEIGTVISASQPVLRSVLTLTSTGAKKADHTLIFSWTDNNDGTWALEITDPGKVLAEDDTLTWTAA